MKPCPCNYCINVRYPFKKPQQEISTDSSIEYAFLTHQFNEDKHVEFNKKTNRWRILK